LGVGSLKESEKLAAETQNIFASLDIVLTSYDVLSKEVFAFFTIALPLLS